MTSDVAFLAMNLRLFPILFFAIVSFKIYGALGGLTCQITANHSVIQSWHLQGRETMMVNRKHHELLLASMLVGWLIGMVYHNPYITGYPVVDRSIIPFSC